jgi:hypothetical protein
MTYSAETEPMEGETGNDMDLVFMMQENESSKLSLFGKLLSNQDPDLLFQLIDLNQG